MVVAALIVELIFNGFALVPSERRARVVEASITWNYTTWLAFLVLAGRKSHSRAESDWPGGPLRGALAPAPLRVFRAGASGDSLNVARGCL